MPLSENQPVSAMPTTVQPAEDSACQRDKMCACHPAAARGAGAPVGAHVVKLSALQRGQTGTICECELGAEDAALLRAMGLCLNARVRLCRAGEPCIVAIQCGRRTPRKIVEDATRRRTARVEGATWAGSRIGLARSLADRILVALDE